MLSRVLRELIGIMQWRNAYPDVGNININKGKISEKMLTAAADLVADWRRLALFILLFSLFMLIDSIYSSNKQRTGWLC